MSNKKEGKRGNGSGRQRWNTYCSNLLIFSLNCLAILSCLWVTSITSMCVIIITTKRERESKREGVGVRERE